MASKPLEVFAAANALHSLPLETAAATIAE